MTLQQIAAAMLAKEKAIAEGREVSPEILRLCFQAANQMERLPPEAQAAANWHLNQTVAQLQDANQAHQQREAHAAVDRYADRLASGLGSRGKNAATMEGGAHKPWSLQEVQDIAANKKFTHTWRENVRNPKTGKIERKEMSEQRTPSSTDNRRANIILGVMAHEVKRVVDPHPHDSGPVLDGIHPQLLADEGRQGDVARAFDYVEANPERFSEEA